MSVELRVTNITRDRRNKPQLEAARALEQARLDQALERLFNERVRLNIQRRLNRRVDAFLKQDVNTGVPA